MKAVVVGAGIGGLAAAVALRDAGVDCVVVERAHELHEVGAGVTVQANGMAALARLGVADGVRTRGGRARVARVRDRRGRLLGEVPYERLGWETYGIHRAELQQALLECATPDVVRLGRACSGVVDTGDRVRALVADGDAEEADLLVGADGIKSTVRAALFGDEPLRYAGYAGWRAVTEFEHELTEGTFNETWGPGVRFGMITIGPGRVYWFVSERVEHAAPEPADPKQAFLRRFADWHEPIPQLIQVTDAGALSRTFVYDRKPLRRWGRGRVTLLGDAAHPMTPDLGQGVAQSLEDAVVLASCLGQADDAETALRAYEGHRVRRANGIVRQSRQAGMLAQRNSALACVARDALVRMVPERVGLATQRRLVAARLE